MKPKQFWRSVLCELLIISLVVSPVWANRPPTLPISSVQVNVSGPMGLQINSFNGNLYYSRSQLTIPDRGLSLAIDLAYNSAQSNLDSGFGFGWQFSYSIFYEEMGNNVLISRGDGRADLYLRDGGQFLRPLGVRDTLETFGSNGYVLTSPDGIKTFFESPAHRHVTRIQDPNGNTLTFGYNGTALASITDASGRQLTLTYEDNRVTVITDRNGTPIRRIRFQYDAAGNLTGLTDPLDHTTAYSYTFVAPYHLLTGLTDPLGNTATITYSGRAVDNITTAITNMSFEYSTETKTTTVTEAVEGGDQVSRYAYDANDRISSIQDGLGHTVTLMWDDRNRLLSYTDQNGHTTSYTYDGQDNVRTVTDPLGQVINYTYDSTFNKVTRITDANGHTTRYEYDRKGNLIDIINALGKKTAFAYDAKGNPLSITDAKNHTTTFSHNANRDLTRAVDPLGQTIRYRLKSEIDPLGHTTRYSYDDAGNLTGKIDANGNQIIYTYNALNRVTGVNYPGNNDASYSYDKVGNLTGTSNADVSVTYRYDAADQLTRVATTVPGLPTKSVRYSYDNVGNRETMTDPNGKITRYRYDDNNRLVRLVNPGQSGTERTSYTYDQAGRLIRKDAHNGTAAIYTYDAADQLRKLTNQTSSGKLLSSFSYQYDRAGNRTRITDAAGRRTKYDYDPLYQLTRVAYPGGAKVAYTYDAARNRDTMTDVNGNPITYTYDAANRLLTVGTTTTYEWDDNGNQIGKSGSEGITSYAYDAEKRLTDITLPRDAGTNHFTYYPDGRRLSATNTAGQTTYFFYDGLNALVETDGSGATTARYTSKDVDDWISMDRSGTTHYYHQDGLGSIVGLTDARQAVGATYQYDAFGAITGETGSIVNPYRFTGREYDSESGLYSYRARYYGADVGRFITQDLARGSILLPATLHRYAYVANNPVNFVDPPGLGFLKKLAKKAGGAVASGAKAVGGAVANVGGTVGMVIGGPVGEVVAGGARTLGGAIATSGEVVGGGIAFVGGALDAANNLLAQTASDVGRAVRDGVQAVGDFIEDNAPIIQAIGLSLIIVTTVAGAVAGVAAVIPGGQVVAAAAGAVALAAGITGGVLLGVGYVAAGRSFRPSFAPPPGGELDPRELGRCRPLCPGEGIMRGLTIQGNTGGIYATGGGGTGPAEVVVVVDGVDAIFIAGRTDVLSIPTPTGDPNVFILKRHSFLVPEFPLTEELPPSIPVVEGAVVRVASPATGGVSFFPGLNGPIFGPDGNEGSESTLFSLDGISGYQGHEGALVGVFLDDTIPNAGPASDILDFTPSGLGTNFASLSPALRQVFFIGDGVRDDGEAHQFMAPSGATRLFLGIPDGFGFDGEPGAYEDNNGGYSARIRANIP